MPRVQEGPALTLTLALALALALALLLTLTLTLTLTLPRVQEAAFLANLLEQACGCAASLGGAGLDFSALLAAPFRAAVLRTLALALILTQP